MLELELESESEFNYSQRNRDLESNVPESSLLCCKCRQIPRKKHYHSLLFYCRLPQLSDWNLEEHAIHDIVALQHLCSLFDTWYYRKLSQISGDSLQKTSLYCKYYSRYAILSYNIVLRVALCEITTLPFTL